MDVQCHIRRDELLKIVHRNKKQHEVMLTEAREGYRKQAQERCDFLHGQLAEGKAVAITWDVAPPRSHIDTYERVIGMLEKSVQEIVELDDHDYACFVDDDWDWARNWALSNSRLSSLTDSYAKAKDWS